MKYRTLKPHFQWHFQVCETKLSPQATSGGKSTAGGIKVK